jgi:hypothetical protein
MVNKVLRKANARNVHDAGGLASVGLYLHLDRYDFVRLSQKRAVPHIETQQSAEALSIVATRSRRVILAGY